MPYIDAINIVQQADMVQVRVRFSTQTSITALLRVERRDAIDAMRWAHREMGIDDFQIEQQHGNSVVVIG